MLGTEPSNPQMQFTHSLCRSPGRVGGETLPSNAINKLNSFSHKQHHFHQCRYQGISHKLPSMINYQRHISPGWFTHLNSAKPSIRLTEKKSERADGWSPLNRRNPLPTSGRNSMEILNSLNAPRKTGNVR